LSAIASSRACSEAATASGEAAEGGTTLVFHVEPIEDVKK
jgi:hypothetical protein